MSTVNQVIFCIESHLQAPMSLRSVAAQIGISQYAVNRAFKKETGRSVISYLRARRLSEAALDLAAMPATDDLVDIALRYQYSSPEAFSRAFKKQFGCNPSEIRHTHTTHKLILQQPLRVSDGTCSRHTTAQEPTQQTTCLFNRIGVEHLPGLQLAGLQQTYTPADAARIPNQWLSFAPRAGHVPGQQDLTTYGVRSHFHPDGRFAYFCGVAVKHKRQPGLQHLSLPAGQWAVFSTAHHISNLRIAWREAQAHCRRGNLPVINPDTWMTAHGPLHMLEIHPSGFDPQTGHGGFRLAIPILKNTD